MLHEVNLENFRDINTPFYFYDVEILARNLKIIKTLARKYDFKVHYALKANSNERILKIISANEFGADCVSKYEIERALQNGFHSQDIVFAGVGKRDDEIEFAIHYEISEVNVESIEELIVIQEIAKKLTKKVNVAIRINPFIDAKTHQLITTGMQKSKFGISGKEIPGIIHVLKNSEFLQFVGIHFHIGSQISDFKVYKRLSFVINRYIKLLEKSGLNIRSVNVGGGIAINYGYPDEPIHEKFEAYFKIFYDNIINFKKYQFKCEPGRSVVGNCGDIITRILYKKPVNGHEMLVVDASMTELIRPALYHSFHKIEPLKVNSSIKKYTVVGPICESSDIFGTNIDLPESGRGDLLRIRSCGAYAESMASKYNLRPFAKAYFSDDF